MRDYLQSLSLYLNLPTEGHYTASYIIYFAQKLYDTTWTKIVLRNICNSFIDGVQTFCFPQHLMNILMKRNIHLSFD